MPLQLLSDIRTEPVPWLWPGRIPFGMTTLVDGDPGVGKTMMVLDLLARLSAGRPLPLAGRHEPMSSLIMTIENVGSQVLRPRLENAGAVMERIGLLTTCADEEGNEVPPSIPEDMDVIKQAIEVMGARVLVIDPIMTYLGDKVNTNNTHQVYRALSPVNELAERTGAAIILLRHLNKDRSGPALYRGQGAMGFVAAVRSAMIVAPAPEVSDVLVVANYKANLAPPVPAITFGMVNCENGAPRVDWGSTSDHTADSLLSSVAGGEERSALHEAQEWLRELLSDGPTLTTEIQRRAREVGIAWATVRRAKDAIRAVSKKAQTQDAKWVWLLPDPTEDAQSPISPIFGTLSTLSTFTHTNNNNNSTIQYTTGAGDEGEGGKMLTDSTPVEHSGEGAQHAQHAQGGGNRVGEHLRVVNVPVATETAYAHCAVCGERIFGIKDRPLLCSTHKAAGGAWRVAD